MKRMLSPWLRRFAALQFAIDTFGPDPLEPESADHELGAVAFYGILRDLLRIATTYVSPTPQGVVRVMSYGPPDANGVSTLVLEVRPIPPLPPGI